MSSNTIASDELRLLIERVERVNDEIKNLQDDRKDVFGEAKARGFDVRAMREVLKLRAMETATRQERESLRETYIIAMGLLDD